MRLALFVPHPGLKSSEFARRAHHRVMWQVSRGAVRDEASAIARRERRFRCLNWLATEVLADLQHLEAGHDDHGPAVGQRCCRFHSLPRHWADQSHTCY